MARRFDSRKISRPWTLEVREEKWDHIREPRSVLTRFTGVQCDFSVKWGVHIYVAIVTVLFDVMCVARGGANSTYTARVSWERDRFDVDSYIYAGIDSLFATTPIPPLQ